jgi:hypothetical protein
VKCRENAGKRLKGLEPSTFCMASSAEVVLKRHEIPQLGPFFDNNGENT